MIRYFEMNSADLGKLHGFLTEYFHAYGMGIEDSLLLDNVMECFQRVADLHHEAQDLPPIRNTRGAGRRPLFTEQDRERILELRGQGMTIRGIASAVMCSTGYVHKIISEQDKTSEHSTRTALHEDGLSESALSGSFQTAGRNASEMRLSDLCELHDLLYMYVQAYERSGRAAELLHEVQDRFEALAAPHQTQNPFLTVTNGRGAGHRPTHTEQDRNLILELRGRGKTYREIAASVPCSISYVHKIITEQSHLT